VHQFSDPRVKHRFATPDVPYRRPTFIHNLIDKCLIVFERDLALLKFFERLPNKVTVIAPLSTGVATEVAHIRNAEAYQFDSVSFTMFRTERMSPVEAFFGELITH
jgi:hypothetical protein